MKLGVITCSEPKDPKAIYIRCMYHTYFWGPFGSEEEASAAIATLDKADPYWDYDCFCMVYGADPLPKDFVFGFPSVSHEMRERIEQAARPNGWKAAKGFPEKEGEIAAAPRTGQDK